MNAQERWMALYFPLLQYGGCRDSSVSKHLIHIKCKVLTPYFLFLGLHCISKLKWLTPASPPETLRDLFFSKLTRFNADKLGAWWFQLHPLKSTWKPENHYLFSSQSYNMFKKLIDFSWHNFPGESIDEVHIRNFSSTRDLPFFQG